MKQLLNWLVYLLFFSLSLGQLGRLSFQGQQVNIYFCEALIVGILAILFIKYKWRPIVHQFRYFNYIYIFLGYLALTFIFTALQYSLEINVISFLYQLRLIGYILLFVYSFYHYQNNKDFKTVLGKGFIVFIVSTVILSTVQFVLYPNIGNIAYLGWDPHMYRLVGTFFDPPVTGAILGLLFLYVVYTFNEKSRVIKNCLLFLFSIGILLTFSRGTLLAFIITLLIIFLKKKDLFKVGIVMICVITFYFIAPKPQGESLNVLRTFTIESRIESYKQGIQVWLKNPVIGVGYNRLRYTKEVQSFTNEYDKENNHSGASLHSSFLVILATGGVIGLAFYIWGLYRLSTIHLGVRNAIMFLSILSITDNILLHPFILILLLMYALSLSDT